MGKRTWIALGAITALIVIAGVGAYVYDDAQKNKISDGVMIGGVDVGGLDQAEAEALVRRKLLAPLQHSLKVEFEDQAWDLPGRKLKLRADIGASVEAAIEGSREGGFPGRLVRYVSGEGVNERISPRIVYSESAVNRFVRRVADEVNREPVNASVEASGDSLEVVSGREGRKLRDNLLTDELKAAVMNPAGKHAILAEVHATQPEVTKKQVAAEYPSYLTLDRGSYTLRLWKDLKLAETYTVAVGQVGLETPEGLYQIEQKEEDPVWHVPESDWAGDLAGQDIPPGPENPLKARWMGIFEGAGIHGTEETSSLGSAVSHGCVRMAIAEVEELYDQVDVGTPIFIG